MAHCTGRKFLKTGAAAGAIASTGALPLPRRKTIRHRLDHLRQFQHQSLASFAAPTIMVLAFLKPPNPTAKCRKCPASLSRFSRSFRASEGRPYLPVWQLDADFLETTPQAENQPAAKSGNPACQFNRSMQPI